MKLEDFPDDEDLDDPARFDPTRFAEAYPAGAWEVPPLEPIPGGLRLPSGSSRTINRTDRRLRTLLDDFAALATAPEEKIGAFALRWGTIGLCPHHVARHDIYAPGPTPTPGEHRSLIGEAAAGKLTVCTGRAMGIEPYAHWRSLATVVIDANELSEIAHGGRGEEWDDDQRRVEAERWARLADYVMPWMGLFREGADPVRYDRYLQHYLRVGREEPKVGLGIFVSWWLKAAQVRPMFLWGPGPGRRRDDRAHLVLQPDDGLGLFGALGIRLAGSVARTVRMAFCDKCGKQLPRTPRAGGTRNWCDDEECLTARNRAYQAEWRKREADKKLQAEKAKGTKRRKP